MTTKATKLNQLIDALPDVCPAGKKAIRNLIAEVTGEVLVEAPTITYATGDRVERLNANGVVQALPKGEVIAINLINGARRDKAIKVLSNDRITSSEMDLIMATRTGSYRKVSK